MDILQLKHGLGEILVKMAIYDLPNATTPDGLLIDVASKVPMFGIMILVFAWCIIFLGGMSRQSKRFGYADTSQWAVLASSATLLLSLVMTIQEGFINIQTLVIVLSITILTAVWFFMSRGRFE